MNFALNLSALRPWRISPNVSPHFGQAGLLNASCCNPQRDFNSTRLVTKRNISVFDTCYHLANSLWPQTEPQRTTSILYPNLMGHRQFLCGWMERKSQLPKHST